MTTTRFKETGFSALDLHPDDVFWCTAGSGWVTGTSYGIIAPLTHGVTSIVDEGEFDAKRWYQVLQAPKTGWSVSFASRSTHTKRLIVKARTLEHQGPAQRWWSTV